MTKLIGFAKANSFTEKQSASHENRKQNKDNKRGISKVSQDSKDADEMMERVISKIKQKYAKHDTSSADSDSVAPDANSSSKSNANAGASFRRQNATGGKRG